MMQSDNLLTDGSHLVVAQSTDAFGDRDCVVCRHSRDDVPPLLEEVGWKLSGAEYEDDLCSILERRPAAGALLDDFGS